MEMLDNAITWFEIPVTDFERAKKFYSSIYDYQMPDTMVGPVRMGFCSTNSRLDASVAPFVLVPGTSLLNRERFPYLNGGSDLDIVLNRVKKAGGKVVLLKRLLPRTRVLCKIH